MAAVSLPESPEMPRTGTPEFPELPAPPLGGGRSGPQSGVSGATWFAGAFLAYAPFDRGFVCETTYASGGFHGSHSRFIYVLYMLLFR